MTRQDAAAVTTWVGLIRIDRLHIVEGHILWMPDAKLIFAKQPPQVKGCGGWDQGWDGDQGRRGDDRRGDRIHRTLDQRITF